MNKQKGFTLIELLVVVAIIGVLATIVLSSLSSARGRAKDVVIRGHFTQIRTALELYYIDNNSYPNSFDITSGWCSNSGEYGGGPCSEITGLTGWIPGLAPDYIPELRSDLVPGLATATWMYKGNQNGYKVMLHNPNYILSKNVSSDDPLRGDNAGGIRAHALIMCESALFCAY